MKRKTRFLHVGMFAPMERQGETIETKVARIVENNEPITDGAPIVYTEKKEGVRPEFDIRTDKWEIAQSAMDSVNREKIAKSKNFKTKENEMDKSNTSNPNENPTNDKKEVGE